MNIPNPPNNDPLIKQAQAILDNESLRVNLEETMHRAKIESIAFGVIATKLLGLGFVFSEISADSTVESTLSYLSNGSYLCALGSTALTTLATKDYLQASLQLKSEI